MEMLLYSNLSVEMLEIVRSSMTMQTEIAADSVYKPFSSKIAALLYLLVHSPRPIVSYYESASV